MKKFYTLTVFLGILIIAATVGSTEPIPVTAKSIYEFKAIDIDGKEISMADFRAKVVLIVNVASKCGYTPQYKGLQELYDKYKDKGLVIIGFPCNQFRNQEPGTNQEIKDFCSVNYGITFPLMDKIDVNGDNAHPLYQYLTTYFGEMQPIKWNFTKFLVGKDGVPIARFETKTDPADMVLEIEEALK